MRRVRTRITALSLVGAAAIVLGGCGDGGTIPPPGGSVAGTTDTNGQVVGDTSTNAVVPGDPNANASGIGGPAGTTGGIAAPVPIPDTRADDVPGLDAISKGADIFAPRATIDDGTMTTTTDTSTTESTDTTPTSTTTTDTTPKVTITYDKATITLDGESYTVTKGATFPKDSGQFQVASITADTVTVNLTAGEFTSGADGIALHTGKTISILNQSEGVSYVLTLESVHHTTSTDGSPTS